MTVPVKPFPEGVLSGAVAAAAGRQGEGSSAKEAAVLIENGAVARWYESNGWVYPVQAPTASGMAAVQQLFETLGLVKPPKVELSEPAVTLRGKPGQRLDYVLTVHDAGEAGGGGLRRQRSAVADGRPADLPRPDGHRSR